MICRLFISWILIIAACPLGYGQQAHVTFLLDKDSVELPKFENNAIDKIVRAQNEHGVKSVVVKSETSVFKSTFQQEADFSNLRFNQVASFAADTFLKGASFSYTDFLNHVWFNNNVCKGAMDFRGVTWSSDVFFIDNIFSSIDFSKGSFHKSVIFLGISFHDRLDFSFCELLDSCQFHFRNCHMPDTINFYHVTDINKDIDLLDIGLDSDRFGKNIDERPYEIRLYKSDISKFHLNYAYFHLSLLDGDGKELDRDEGIGLYEALLKNFNDRGQKVSAEKLDIEYQQYKWRTGPKSIAWVGTVSNLWWRFGYAKERIFCWTLILLIFFTLTTLPILPFLQHHVYSLNALNKREGQPFYKWRRLWYSFVYAGTIFFKLTLQGDNIKFGSKPQQILGTLYVLFVFVIGVLCLGYMANFLLQK